MKFFPTLALHELPMDGFTSCSFSPLRSFDQSLAFAFGRRRVPAGISVALRAFLAEVEVDSVHNWVRYGVVEVASSHILSIYQSFVTHRSFCPFDNCDTNLHQQLYLNRDWFFASTLR